MSNPFETYVLKDERWLENSWRKVAPDILDFIKACLKPEHEVTLIQLQWNGHVRHSKVKIEVWRNRNEYATIDIVLMPLLISIWETASIIRSKTAINTRAYLRDLIRHPALIWKPRTWWDARSVWKLCPESQKELTNSYGGF